MALRHAVQARSICGSVITLLRVLAPNHRVERGRVEGRGPGEADRREGRHDDARPVPERRVHAGEVLEQHRQRQRDEVALDGERRHGVGEAPRDGEHRAGRQAHALGRAGGPGGERHLRGALGEQGGRSRSTAEVQGRRRPRSRRATRIRGTEPARESRRRPRPASACSRCAGVKKDRQWHVHDAGPKCGEIGDDPRGAVVEQRGDGACAAAREVGGKAFDGLDQRGAVDRHVRRDQRGHAAWPRGDAVEQVFHDHGLRPRSITGRLRSRSPATMIGSCS